MIKHHEINIVLLFFIGTAIFAGQYVDFLSDSSLSKVMFAVSFLAFSLFNYRRILTIEGLNSIAITTIFLLLISFKFWDYFTNVIAYTGILFAFVIYKSAPVEFKKITTFFFYVIFFVTVFEFLTKKYLFVPEISIGGNKTLVIHEAIGSIFRPKSFFNGALTLGYFYVLIAFLHRNNKNILFLCLIGAYLSGVRLAFVSLMGFVILTGGFSYVLKSKYFYIGLFISITIIFFTDLGDKIFDKASYERLMKVFDSSQVNNFQRILFWILGLEFYLNYDSLHLVFGNNGAFRAAYNNGTENGWLSLLVDSGILGFLLYFIVLSRLFFRKILTDKGVAIMIFIIMFATFITSFHASRVTSILIWFLVFYSWDNIPPVDYSSDSLEIAPS